MRYKKQLSIIIIFVILLTGCSPKKQLLSKSVVYESTLGYTCKYDSSFFKLDDTTSEEKFFYQSEEKLELPVYFSVQKLLHFKESDIIEGISWQSGGKNLDVQDVQFGTNKITAKKIYVESSADAKYAQTFYIIPFDEGVWKIEIGGCVEEPEAVKCKIDEIMESFTIADDVI